VKRRHAIRQESRLLTGLKLSQKNIIAAGTAVMVVALCLFNAGLFHNKVVKGNTVINVPGYNTTEVIIAQKLLLKKDTVSFHTNDTPKRQSRNTKLNPDQLITE